ncbi:AfsR/SARP family transcriptional regulator [Actinopolymorpha alba]|uniref:AfsR/SARP family transcriptional regulator n=1 Tax=Actinopolymorpha alba TaxID=533267 RepID=UPI00036ADA1D|nr:BTAD domain-containing putative transcriptional regulator [Actinopolymorpha alba]
MRFGVLGPIEVLDDDGFPVDLGWPKQRLVLAILLSDPGRAVSVDRLIDVVWSGEPPRSARTSLQILVQRLRRALGDSSRIVHQAAAYALDVRQGELDVERFERLVADGRMAREAGDLAKAADLLDEALSLWRGEAYADVAVAEVVREEAGRLAEVRLAALGDRLDADLALGRHAEVVAELRTLVARNPFGERLRALLMLALYRSGRAAEALEVYRQGRQVLVDELGLEPGTELRELEQAILTEDPSLDRPSGNAAVATGSAPRVVPAELPPTARTFTGRQADLARLTGWLAQHHEDATPVTVAISGLGGIGKSALAVQAAQAVAADFPDGQLYVNLHGATPGLAPLAPHEVISRFLRSLGLSDDQIPAELEEAAARFRTLTSGRRLLVVLDDAVDAAHVRPLLPGGADSAVLITSRTVLAAVDNATHLHLELLSDDEAVVLLSRLVGPRRVAAESDAAARIAELCGRLPLALRIAGARLAARPDLPLTSMVDRITDARGRLDELAYADLGVRASFAVSCQALPAGAARLFELLGLLDLPDLTLPVAGALVDRPAGKVRRDLDRLVDAQLVTAGAGDRYSLHDLLRLFAREQAAERLPEIERTEALRRVLHWYLATARQAMRRLSESFGRRDSAGIPDSELRQRGLELDGAQGAAQWITIEANNVLAAARQALKLPGDGPSIVAGLAAAVYMPLHKTGRWNELIGVNQLALVASEHTGEQLWKARAHNDMGWAYRELRRFGEALNHLEEALDAYRAVGYLAGEAHALNGLGAAYKESGRLDTAIEIYRAALAIRRKLQDSRGEVVVLNNISDLLRKQGKLEEAIAHSHQCLAIHEELGESTSMGITLGNLGKALHRSGRADEALPRLEQAITVLRRTATYRVLPELLWDLGSVLHELGRLEDARDRWREALDALCEMSAMTTAEADRILSEPVPTQPDILR